MLINLPVPTYYMEWVVIPTVEGVPDPRLAPYRPQAHHVQAQVEYPSPPSLCELGERTWPVKNQVKQVWADPVLKGLKSAQILVNYLSTTLLTFLPFVSA